MTTLGATLEQTRRAHHRTRGAARNGTPADRILAGRSSLARAWGVLPAVLARSRPPASTRWPRRRSTWSRPPTSGGHRRRPRADDAVGAAVARRRPRRLLLRARGIIEPNPSLRRFAPLSREQSVAAPTTGYHDVRLVALARLGLPSMRSSKWTGTVRAEARAGGADVRRQPPRSRLAGRRSGARAAPASVGGGAPQHRGGRVPARRARRGGMRPARLGAVSYLNTSRWSGPATSAPTCSRCGSMCPSVCASLLHDGRVDLGLIPAIEYLRGDYAIVPGIAIGSDGPVDSVAIFTTRADRARANAGPGHQLADVGGLTQDPVRGSTGPSRPSSRRPSRTWRHAGAGRCRPGDWRPGARDRTATARGNRSSISAQAWHALTGLPFVYAAWVGP